MTGAEATVAVGDVREDVLVTDLTRSQIVMYAGAAGDFTPLHTDEPYAQAMGYPSVFAHGTLLMGMTARVLTDWFGDDRLRRFEVRFVDQAYPGDTLTARAVVSALRADGDGPLADVEVSTRNQHGTVLLTGSAVVRLA